jgi:ABC-type nitrate/sulfonate/bicarbonate transport system substrate-binding protein
MSAEPKPEPKPQPRSRAGAWLLLAVLVAALAGGGYFAYTKWGRKPDGPGALKFATSKNAWCTLTIVAHKKGYFAEEGLDVNLEYVQAARFAMDALISGDAQFGNVVETNFAFLSFTGSTDVEAVATHADVRDGAIVARKDRGITKPADLKGKRLGILQGTTSHIYAERFLEAHGLTLADVQVRNLQPAAIQTALTVPDGDLDAGSLWQPMVFGTQGKLGANAVVFSDPSAYAGQMSLAVRKDWSAKYPTAVPAVLRAHVKAEQFVRANRAEAIKLVAAEIGLSEADLTAIWDQYGYRVYLGPRLPAEIARQAQWLTAVDDKFKGKPVPALDWAVNAAPLRALDAARVEK